MTGRKYSGVFLLVFWVLGYLLIRFGGRATAPIWAVVTYVVFLVSFKLERGRLNRAGIWLSLAPILTVLACTLGETRLPPMARVMIPGMFAASAYVTLGGVHRDWKRVGFLGDVGIGLLYLPFAHLHESFKTAREKLRAKTGAKRREVWLGILILIPLLLVSLALLGSADLVFSNAMKRLWGEILRFPLRWVFELVGAWVIATVLFSALSGFAHPWKASETVRKEHRTDIKTVSVVLVPLIAVYVLFVASQIYQLVLFFSKAEAYIGYARFAREGFFALVCAAGLNLAVVLAFQHFLAREQRELRLWKVCSRLFTALTFAVSVCSMIRVCEYIGEYGMTRLRIQSVWGIVLIVLALSAVMTKLFAPRVRLFPILLCLVMFWYGGLCYVQSDALIAGYNVRAYLSGDLASLDFSAMARQSDDAVVALEYFCKHCDPNDRYWAQAQTVLNRKRTEAVGQQQKNITVFERIWQKD